MPSTTTLSHTPKIKKQSDSGPELEGPRNLSFKNKKNILFVQEKSITDKKVSKTATSWQSNSYSWSILKTKLFLLILKRDPSKWPSNVHHKFSTPRWLKSQKMEFKYF